MDIHLLRKVILITPLSLLLSYYFFRDGIIIINKKGHAIRGVNESIIWCGNTALLLFNFGLPEPTPLFYIYEGASIVFGIVFIVLLVKDLQKKYRLKIYNISTENLTVLLENVLLKNDIKYHLIPSESNLDKLKHEIIISNWRSIEQLPDAIKSLKKILRSEQYRKVRVLGIVNVFLGFVFIVSGVIVWII
jgi:hypothetical protein